MKYNLLKYPALLSVCLIARFGVEAQVSFTPQVTYGTTNSEYDDVVVGDMNGDGMSDLVTTGNGGNSVLLADGNGGYKQSFYAGFGGAVAIDDLNGDGMPDILSCDSFLGDVNVLLADGKGGYTAATTYRSNLVNPSPYKSSVVIVDMNGDGESDIVVSIGDSRNIAVLFADGKGSYTTSNYTTGGREPVSASVADINDDGKPDLVTANYSSDNGSVLLAGGNGSYTASTFGTGRLPISVAIGDLNGDGKADVVTGNGGGSISVLLGIGDGTFHTQVGYATSTPTNSVAIGDLDGDGNLDIVTTGNNTVSVLQGNGDGTFQLRVDFAAGDSPLALAIADLNGDDKPDIVTSNGGGGVSVLLNTTPFATPVAIETFTGALHQSTAALSWESGVESNLKQYEVEANVNNKGFSAVGIVAAKGSNSTYSYSTRQFVAKTDYRLKLVDNNGKYAYSDVITLSQNKNNNIKVYPNPATDNIYLNLPVAGTLRLYDVSGKCVKTLSLLAGVNRVDVRSLSAGVYYGVVGGMKLRFLKK